MDQTLLYVALLVRSGFLLAVAVLSFAAAPQQTQTAAGDALAAENGSSGVPAECGDLSSLSNLQHLSHHPDRYQECYKLADPALFKQATGRDISEFMR